MVDDLRQRSYSFALALLAKRRLLDLQGAEVAPRFGLIELVIGVQPPLLDSALRHPRTLLGFLDSRHSLEYYIGS